MEMRKLKLMVLFSLLVTISRGQQSDFDLRDIKFGGVEFITTKAIITKSFGPAKKVETNYDCGFFTNDQPDGPYYQLVYTAFNFIGSDKGKFFLENVNFDLKGQVKLKYLGNELSGRTSKEDFVKIFGDKAKAHFKEHPDSDVLFLYSKHSDAGARFTFKNGKLFKFEYWTPC